MFLEHLESKYLHISVNLRSKVSGGEGGLNNFLQDDHCLGLVKCFKIFHFNLNFWKFNYFLAFRYLHHWNFPGNSDFKGKVVAKFLLRSHFLSICNTLVSHFLNFALSPPLWYLLKITNYLMREKKIFCIYGCFFSVSPYIQGGRKSIFRHNNVSRQICTYKQPKLTRKWNYTNSVQILYSYLRYQIHQ